MYFCIIKQFMGILSFSWIMNYISKNMSVTNTAIKSIINTNNDENTTAEFAAIPTPEVPFVQ